MTVNDYPYVRRLRQRSSEHRGQRSHAITREVAGELVSLSRIHSFKHAIRCWLKAGAIEFGRFTKTKKGMQKGMPQGGVISPLLANIALDGMDNLYGATNSKGNYKGPSYRRGKNKGIVVVRYADDLVIVAPSREILVEHVIPRLRDFLKERGLTLNGAKTRIVYRKEGFDFLGFHVQQFESKYNKIYLVKPSKENVKRVLGRVKEILMTNKQATQVDLIDMLNPVLRGWTY